MMIFGVAYHILPRFSGRPLWSDKLALVQLYLANIGLIGMAAGWVILSGNGSKGFHIVFSLVEAVSIVLFVINMFLTIKAAPPMPQKPAPDKK